MHCLLDSICEDQNHAFYYVMLYSILMYTMPASYFDANKSTILYLRVIEYQVGSHPPTCSNLNSLVQY